MTQFPPPTRRHARPGFTVVELLVVVALITLLIALLFPAFAYVRASARNTGCMNNQRQIAQAHATYTTANKGKFVSPRTDREGVTTSHTASERLMPWVLAIEDNSNYTQGGVELPAAIEEGALFPYVGSLATYVSPNEPLTDKTNPLTGANRRLRSYSLNAFVGVSRVNEDPTLTNSIAAGLSLPVQYFDTTSLGQLKHPSRTLCSIIEDDRVKFNQQGWLVDPVQNRWIDSPAMWQPKSITHSYMDGSIGSYAIVNPDLVTALETTPHNYLQPNDPDLDFAVDWKYFRDRLLPGVVPNSTYGFSE